MEKDTLKDLFENLQGSFDIENLQDGHEQRFLNKLNADNKTAKKGTSYNWKTFLAIAASVVICFTIFTKTQNEPEFLDLANVSPELSEAQDFFTVTLQTELKKLNSERSPFTENIINDALEQINILETNYQKLKIDLIESGKDQRVIYAMIQNFQSRIDILNSVLEQIETVKHLKNKTNETTNTI